MNSVKLNKKHLFSFLITLVLLFSLNLNTFASSSFTVNFYNQPFVVLSSNGNITNTTIITESTFNGLHYTKFNFPLGVTYSKVITTGADPVPLYTDTTYNYSLYTESSSADYSLKVSIAFYNAQNELLDGIMLVDGVFPHNTSGSNGEYVINEHKGTINIQPVNGVTSYCLIVVIGDDTNDYYCSNLFLYDMTFTAQGPLYGKPITPADTSGLTAIMGDYDNAINDLPSIKDYDTDTLFDVNVDSYTSAMSFVKDMFDNFMVLSGLNSVLIFALCIGLATYIIGRKVG